MLISPRRAASRYPQLRGQTRCSSGFTFGLGTSRSMGTRTPDAVLGADDDWEGSWELPQLDAQVRTVTWQGQTETLGPDRFLILSRLLAGGGELVTREALQAAEGEHGPYSQSALTQHIGNLRKMGLPIANVPWRGFRLQLDGEG